MADELTPPSEPRPENDPLSAGQRAALGEATQELRGLLRSSRIANVTAGSLLFFGAITLAWGAVSGGGGVLIGLALLAVAWNERRGRDRLRAIDPEGARVLGWNQLALAAVVAVYGLVAILRAGEATDPSMQQLEELVGISPELVAEITRRVYGSAIVAVALIQGVLARYHFRQRARMEDFRRRTPSWVLQTLTDSGAAASR